MDTLRVKFWGTRGIIPSPRKNTIEFGGNTTCIQVVFEDKLIVVDMGHGAALFGETLEERILNKNESFEIHIFFTHFHWDHILGLPFFHPIYYPSTVLHIYAPVPVSEMWESLDVLFDGSYSPFAGIDSMPSKIHFHELKGTLALGNLIVDYIPLNHHIHGQELVASDVYSYRFKAGRSSLVLASDHDAHPSPLNDAFVEFAKGADILVHDAQYTEKDVLVGWGHSTVTQALDNARRIDSRLCLLTHHDPERDDADIHALDAEYKAKPEYKGLHFEFAREGVLYATSAYKK